MKRTVAWIFAAALLVSSVSLPASAGQSPAAASSKDALAVLSRMVEAMGGRRLLESIKDTTLTGTTELVQMGVSAPLKVYQKEPNKLRIDVDISAFAPGVTFTQAFDGTRGWGTNMQTLRNEPMSEALSKDFSHQALGNDSLLNPQKLGITYALKPKAMLEGKDYIILEQTLADGHKTSMFIDPATYLTYKAVTTAVDPLTLDAVEVESYLGDYRKVGGLMVSHSLRTLQNGSENMRMTITAVTTNSHLDDALFVLK